MLELPERTLECPECGETDRDFVWRNSSDQIVCDNCGFDETMDEEELDEIYTDGIYVSD